MPCSFRTVRLTVIACFLEGLSFFVVGAQGPCRYENVNKIAQKEQVCHLRNQSPRQPNLVLMASLMLNTYERNRGLDTEI
jgi:hypothetical protein